MGNRILKQSICTSDTIEALSAEEERLFYRLIVNADDFGRLDGRLPIIRATCFPLRTEIPLETLATWMARLEEVQLVVRYTVGRRPYYQITSWESHQQVRNKRSRFPAPDDEGAQIVTSEGARNHLQSSDINCVSVSESLSVSEYESKETHHDDNARARDDAFLPEDVARLAAHWGRFMAGTLTPTHLERLTLYRESDGPPLDVAVLEWAMEQCALHEKRHLSYLDSILRNCQTRGHTTLAKVLAHEARRKEQPHGPQHSARRTVGITAGRHDDSDSLNELIQT